MSAVDEQPATPAPDPLAGLLEVNSPTWGAADEALAERLAAALGDDAVEGTLLHRGELTVIVPAARLRDVARHLRDAEGYDFLSDVTAIDYLGYEGEVAGYWGTGRGRDLNRTGSWGKAVVPQRPGERRFAINVHLAKVTTRDEDGTVRLVPDGGHVRLRVQTWVDDGEAVPSLIPVYPSADFHEREAWDFFGIVFLDHPNLRRILMPEDWGGHPQRKDYPIGGEPVQFSEAQ